KFVSRAPENVVEGERNKRVKYDEMLRAVLKRLENL
ncbi:MAG TPA: hypothetical protein DD429_10655, partial [Clostridiaceae bacterium]|nr:hypothetical protein [Clostridiaceae bacterium]